MDRSKRTVEALKSQSIAFFLAFLISHMPGFSTHFTSIKEGDIMTSSTIALTIIALLFYTSQGVFNLCAHLDPMTRRISKGNADISYWKAIIIAIRTYDDGLDKRTEDGAGPRRNVLADRSFRRSSRRLNVAVENV